MDQQTQRKVPIVIDALIGYGIFGCISFIAVTIAVLLFAYKFALLPSQSPALPGTTSTIGELGSRCGGSEGLPCMPGFVCSVKSDAWNTTYGECVTDTRSSQQLGILGSECRADLGCGPGLRCAFEGENATGTCESVSTSTPATMKSK